jgi:hypothetical protein
MTRFLSVLLLALVAMPTLVLAADTAPAVEAAPKQDPADLDERIALSKEWHKLMPISVREQIDAAVDQVAQTQPENEREVFKANMKAVLNYQALEKISIDAMADTYTVAELKAMNEYYAKPEAKSAQPKYNTYANIVFPEITRMLDQAMMRVRTGGTGQ